jgi:hypothetical protein
MNNNLWLTIVGLLAFLTLVNAVSEHQKMIDLVNEYRAQNGKPPVPTGYWLTATAMLHTIDRRDNGFPNTYGCTSGHSWSGASSLFSGPCCYSGANWQCMGMKPSEISSGRYTGIGYEDWVQAGSVEQALNAWKGSPSHNDVILNLNGWAGSPWGAIGAGYCGGFYGLWFSTTPDPNPTADIELLTCSLNVNGPIPDPAAAASKSATPKSASPSLSSVPSQSSVPSVSSVPSQSAIPSQSSVPSESSVPSQSAIPSQSSVSSESSVPSESSIPSQSSSTSHSEIPSQSTDPSQSSVPSQSEAPSQSSGPSQSSEPEDPSQSSEPSQVSAPSVLSSSIPSESSSPSSSSSLSPAPVYQYPAYWLGDMTLTNSEWAVVRMNQYFVKPVVVCSMYYSKEHNPMAIRIRNADTSSFEVQTIPINGGSFGGPVDVDCMVVEAGVYTAEENGIQLEASFVSSSMTSTVNNFDTTGTSISFSNSYAKPVVLGQVMTANNPQHSSFYARGSDIFSPISGSGCVIGKQGSDSSATLDEEIGYIVIEAGIGIFGGRKYEAIQGSNTISGIGNTDAPESYPLSTSVKSTFGVNSVNSMFTQEGGFSVFYGDRISAYENQSIALVIDGSRETPRQTSESVGCLMFQ